MTSLATTQLTSDLLDKNQFTLLFQSGSNAGTSPSVIPVLTGVPLMASVMQDKVTDPVAQKAFAYWSLNSSINNWLALPHKTPDAILKTYRSAFDHMTSDEDFLKRAQQVGEDLSVFSHQEMTQIIRTLAALPPEALSYMGEILVRQGLKKDTAKE